MAPGLMVWYSAGVTTRGRRAPSSFSRFALTAASSMRKFIQREFVKGNGFVEVLQGRVPRPGAGSSVCLGNASLPESALANLPPAGCCPGSGGDVHQGHARPTRFFRLMYLLRSGVGQVDELGSQLRVWTADPVDPAEALDDAHWFQ